MQIHELTPAECRDVLSRATLGRLACSRDAQPYIVPVSFAYDEPSQCLYGFSGIGRKIDWMRRNPKVCVEVEDIGDRLHWTTVVVVGRYDEIEDAPELRPLRQRALELFERRAEWWLPGAARTGPREHPSVVVYRVHIVSVTGRRAAGDGS